MFTPNVTLARRLTQAVATTSILAIAGTASANGISCPHGSIQKLVKNQTAGGQFADANTTSAAVTAKPGDTVVYEVIVSDASQSGDMVDTKVTDTLPAGLQLVSEDNLNLGTITAGQKKTVTITAKVTATQAGSIKNQACFTGNGKDHNMAQQGCDVAYITVVIPTPTPTPSPSKTPCPTPTSKPSTSPSPTPTTTPTGGGQTLGTSTQPTTLPDTGAPVAGTTVGLGAMIAAGTAYIKSRKRK